MIKPKLNLNMLSLVLGYEEWETKALRRHLQRAGIVKPAAQWVWANRPDFLHAARAVDRYLEKIDSAHIKSNPTEIRDQLNFWIEEETIRNI